MKVKKWLLGLMTFAAMAVVCAVCAGAENEHTAYIMYADYDWFPSIMDYSGYYEDSYGDVTTWNSKTCDVSKSGTYTVSISDIKATIIDEETGEDLLEPVTGEGAVVFRVDIDDLSADFGLGSGSKGYDELKTAKEYMDFAKKNGADVTDVKITQVKDGKTTTVPVDMSKIHFGDLEGNGKFIIDIYNEYSDTKSDPPIDTNKINFDESLSVQFTITLPKAVQKPERSEYGYTVLDDGTVEITGYNGNDTDVVVPDKIDGKTVTSIGFAAFKDSTYLTSIMIPKGVMYINNQTFEDCTNLKSITIPDGVLEIGSNAFKGCKSLKSITMPDSVWKIGSGTFEGCKSLTAINVATGNQYYVSVSGVLYNKDKTTIICYPAGKKDKNYKIPDGVTEIDWYAFLGCANLASITIPNSVTEIGWFAFSGCTSLTNVTIPDSVTSIGRDVFSKTALLENQTTSEKYVGKWVVECDDDARSITIKNGTKGIANSAFEECTSLTSVTIPNGVTSIADSAFSGCISLTNIKIPASVTSIGDSTFNYCNILKSITIPNSVTNIGDDAFRYCVSLKSINIPDSITEIGYEAFMGCTSLKSITIPASVTSIGWNAFGYISSGEKVDDFKINYVKYTEGHRYAVKNGFTNEMCFTTRELDNGSLCITGYVGNLSSSSLVIPSEINGKQVTEISNWAFEDCEALKSITIPDSVTCIGVGAFKGSGLTTVKLPEKLTDIGVDAFVGTPIINNQKTEIKYIGKTIVGCDSDAETLTIGDDVTAIASNAFITGEAYIKCSKLKSITVSKNVKYIGEHAIGYRLGLAKDYTYDKIDNFKIYCYSSTAGEQYAKDNGFTYELLKMPTLSKVTGVKLGGRAADALRVNWTKNASADGYIVEMYQNGKWARVAKITSNSTTTFRKAGLKAGTVYKFRVKAYKMSGKTAVYGAYSATVAARTNPSVIKGAKLGGRAADALRINWTKNASADGYIVEMYQGNKWVRVAKITNGNTTTFRKAGLKASTVYKFRVRAYKMSGKTALYGNYSATVTARTNPSVMKGVKIGGKAKDALRVNWTKNASAQGYIVEMYKGGKWVRVAKITNNSTTTFRKSGLAKNTAYKFRVRAYHMSGKTALYGNYGSVSGKTAAK